MRPILVLLLILVPPFASGTHSASPCDSTVVTIDAIAETFYLVLGPEDTVWMYVESNGHPDLQRGGSVEYPLWSADAACWDVEIATGEHVEPDFLLF